MSSDDVGGRMREYERSCATLGDAYATSNDAYASMNKKELLPNESRQKRYVYGLCMYD